MNIAGKQGFLDFLGEQALAADFRQRAVPDLIAGDTDHNNLNIGWVQSMGCNQPVAGFVGLDQSQRRSPRAYSQLSHLQVISIEC